MNIDDTETLLESDDNAKHKVVFIAGFLERSYPSIVQDDDSDGTLVTTDFLCDLNRGGLKLLTMSLDFVCIAQFDS